MRRAWSVVASSVVIALVAGVLAGLAYGAWSSRNPSWTSMTTFNVTPLTGTDDPDRVIATQIQVLESRTQRRAVAQALSAPTSFRISAEQRRLSDVVDVTVTSPRRATATRAAAVVERTYPARAGGATTPVVRVTVLDAPLPATRNPIVRDSALVGLGAAALVVAAIAALAFFRPRVKRSYELAPVDAVVLELPAPGRRGSSRRSERAAELRRLAGLVVPVDDERPRPRVAALPGVDAAALDWVTEVLGGVSADDAEPSAPGEERPWTVLVARGGVDTERVLRKEVQSSALFSEVMVVLLGARRPALVAPTHATGSALRGDDGAGPAPHRTGQAVWR